MERLLKGGAGEGLTCAWRDKNLGLDLAFCCNWVLNYISHRNTVSKLNTLQNQQRHVLFSLASFPAKKHFPLPPKGSDSTPCLELTRVCGWLSRQQRCRDSLQDSLLAGGPLGYFICGRRQRSTWAMSTRVICIKSAQAVSWVLFAWPGHLFLFFVEEHIWKCFGCWGGLQASHFSLSRAFPDFQVATFVLVENINHSPAQNVYLHLLRLATQRCSRCNSSYETEEEEGLLFSPWAGEPAGGLSNVL